METFPIKARAAHAVAGYLQHQSPPDLVLSVGHSLPCAAQVYVHPLGESPRAAGERSALAELKRDDGTKISEDKVCEAIASAIRLDEEMGRQLGREPDILLHCQHGETRSVMVGLALYGARMLRKDPDLTLVGVFDALKDLLYDSMDAPVDWQAFSNTAANSALKHFELYIGKPLKTYRDEVQKRSGGPARPEQAAHKPSVLTAKR